MIRQKVKTKQTNLLVTYESNWADEIDIRSSLPLTLKEWIEICREAKLAFAKYKTCTHYVGTNEDIVYSSYKEWLAHYSIIELTYQEFKTFNKFKGVLDNNKFFIPEYYEED